MSVTKQPLWPRVGAAVLAIMLGIALGACRGGDTASMMAEARQYRDGGDIKAAVIELKNIIQRDADNRAGRFWSRWSARCKNWDARPMPRPASTTGSSSCQRLGERRALGFAQRAYQVAPENPAVIDTLGWIFLEQGELARLAAAAKGQRAGAPRRRNPLPLQHAAGALGRQDRCPPRAGKGARHRPWLCTPRRSEGPARYAVVLSAFLAPARAGS